MPLERATEERVRYSWSPVGPNVTRVPKRGQSPSQGAKRTAVRDNGRNVATVLLSVRMEHISDVDDGDGVIYPRRFLPRLRALHPGFIDLIVEAEMSVAAVEALASTWRSTYLNPLLPLTARKFSAGELCSMFSVLAAQRSVALADGLARELEGNALFPAAAIARAHLEVVGLTSLAKEEVTSVLPNEVGDVLLELLLGPALMKKSEKRHRSPEQLRAGVMRAAKRQLGQHFGGDYGFLSEIVHPHGLVLFGADHDLGTLTFEPGGISSGAAELLIKVCGQGTRWVGHNCQWLLDWSHPAYGEVPTSS